MKGFDLIAPTLERSAVVQETLRIFEVCDGCRRCFNLCPSFNTLLAPLANWATAQSWFRGILHRIVGIHRDRQLVRFQEETFPHWLQRTREDRRRGLYVGKQAEVGAGGESAGPPPAAKVVLFST